MRTIPQAAVDLVARWEAKRLKAYPDPATGGEPWTIGYGHTGGVRPGQLINEMQAQNFLRSDLKIAAGRLDAQIGAEIIAELTDNQYAALLSFVFNLGAKPQWVIWKRLKARKFELVPNEMNRFVYASGRRLQGLANRRAAEVALWRTGEPGTEDENPPSSITRLAATPPIATEPPARKSATIWTVVSAPFLAALAFVQEHIKALVGWVTSIVTPDSVNQGIAAISPYAEKSHWVAGALQGLAVLGALLAAILVMRKHNEGRP